MVAGFSPALNAARIAFPLPAVTASARTRPSFALAFAGFSGLVARSARGLACRSDWPGWAGPPLRTASFATAARRRSKSLSLRLASEPSRSPGKRTGSLSELPRVTGVSAEAAAWLKRSELSVFELRRRILKPNLPAAVRPPPRSGPPQPRLPRPAIVKAAVEGRLPYGLTASSFSELPILWEEQLPIAS
jgi:hypothetical protein